MKKTLALLLALLLLAGCGATPAQPEAPAANPPAEVTDDRVPLSLRAGEIVEVADDAEFVAAYLSLYRADSTVSCIRLIGDCAVYNKAFRPLGGGDPYMTGYEGTLCVRMPEGTCIDLNGFTLALRGNQGLDDSGTGTPSGLNTVGTVVDTYGGGKLNFYVVNEARYIDHALKLAEQYTDNFDCIVSVSSEMTDAQGLNLVVPPHVCLRFSGKESAVNADSITFRPTATSELAQPETASGLKNTKKVVFEYQDDGDKIRLGTEFATETVQGEAVPAQTLTRYKLEIPSLSASEAEVPVIADSSVETAEAAVLQNPANVTFTPAASYTREEMTKALIETALAYYYHNPHVQYDGRSVTADDSISRHFDHGKPEQADVDSPVYSVCSNYTYKSYYEAFGYRLLGKSFASTKQLATLADDNPTLVYKYAGTESGKDVQTAMAESRKLLQPGDIITGYGKSGHSMLYIGDYFGDGTEYCLHCWGSSFTVADGKDPREVTGSIYLQPVDQLCYEEGYKPSWYLATDAHSSVGFSIYRPFNDPEFPSTLTADACVRLAYPGLEIWRQLDRTQFNAAQEGEEIPVTVSVTNNSIVDYAELPVTETVPQGTEFVAGSATAGIEPKDGTLSWAVKIPAGKTIRLTYKVKITAKKGETVQFTAGSVAGIASRATSLVVGGQPYGYTEEARLLAAAKALDGTKSETYLDLAAVEGFYETALGTKLGLPDTVSALMDKLFETEAVNGQPYVVHKQTIGAEDTALKQMLLPLHLSGTYFVSEEGNWGRVREYRTCYYEPGDIFVGLSEPNTTKAIDKNGVSVYVYLGGGRALSYDANGNYKLLPFSETIGLSMRFATVFALRPSLAN